MWRESPIFWVAVDACLAVVLWFLMLDVRKNEATFPDDSFFSVSLLLPEEYTQEAAQTASSKWLCDHGVRSVSPLRQVRSGLWEVAAIKGGMDPCKPATGRKKRVKESKDRLLSFQP